MDSLLNEILTLVLAYGYPIVAVTVLASSIGVPLPMTPILVVSGSLAAMEDLNLVSLVVLVTGCSVAGDSVGYHLGTRVGSLVVERLGNRSARTRTSIEVAQQYFRQWSGLTIFVTRWLFTPFSSLVNLLAGIAQYPFRRFLIFDALGEAISSTAFLTLGYVFGVSGRYIWDYFDGVPGIVASAAIGIVFLVSGGRWLLRGRQPDPGKGSPNITS